VCSSTYHSMSDSRNDDGALANAEFAPGSVLVGRYRIEKMLGRGGMGVVLAARHLELDQPVAVKALLPDVLGQSDAVERFLREARAAVQLRGEHVARVLDVGRLSSGVPYMVMEYLDGVDLSELIRQRGALTATEAVEYVLQALESIAEAHQIGIVHRDLKPANLFLTERPGGAPLVKVIDFGISKIVTRDKAVKSLTSTSAVFGSPYYMSPEQLQSSKTVDCRSDIWALGVVLHELCAGTPPFDAESVAHLAVSIATTAPPPLRSVRVDAPAELERIILRCLEKDPAQRYQTVAELARALAPLAPTHAAQASVEQVVRMLEGKTTTGSTVRLPATSPMSHNATALAGSSGKTADSDRMVGQPNPARTSAAVAVEPVPRRNRSSATVMVAGLLGAALLGGVAVLTFSRLDASGSVAAADSRSAPALDPSPPAASIPAASLPTATASAPASSVAPTSSIVPPTRSVTTAATPVSTPSVAAAKPPRSKTNQPPPSSDKTPKPPVPEATATGAKESAIDSRH
jgi:eukaryotic-like serine/threonine-protein kinase